MVDGNELTPWILRSPKSGRKLRKLPHSRQFPISRCLFLTAESFVRIMRFGAHKTPLPTPR
jgi:hypothetical protein